MIDEEFERRAERLKPLLYALTGLAIVCGAAAVVIFAFS